MFTMTRNGENMLTASAAIDASQAPSFVYSARLRLLWFSPRFRTARAVPSIDEKNIRRRSPSLAKSVAEPQQRRHPSERAVGASANELHTYTSTVICLTLSPAGHVNDAPTERKENKFHFFFGKEKVGAVFFDVSGPRSGTWVIPVINNSCDTKEGYAKDCGRGQ